jgi:hypothetical protein
VRQQDAARRNRSFCSRWEGFVNNNSEGRNRHRSPQPITLAHRQQRESKKPKLPSRPSPLKLNGPPPGRNPVIEIIISRRLKPLPLASVFLVCERSHPTRKKTPRYKCSQSNQMGFRDLPPPSRLPSSNNPPPSMRKPRAVTLRQLPSQLFPLLPRSLPPLPLAMR